MQRLTVEQWTNILRNVEEDNDEIEVLWLDTDDEWVLACNYELFEDGFKTEKEAISRLDDISELILDEELDRLEWYAQLEYEDIILTTSQVEDYIRIFEKARRCGVEIPFGVEV